MKPPRATSRPGRSAGITTLKASSASAPAALSLRGLTTERLVSTRTPLDSLSTSEIVRRIHEQDASVPAAVARELPQVANAVRAAVLALSRGGRLFYVGAGTSGRLGVLDAAECPPTFGIEPEKIQAVIAGGPRALLHASEAAEDNAEQGARDLAARKVGPRDVVIGVSASGRTPYTVGAIRYARARRATTVAIACNPGSPLERAAHIGIIPLTGPEILSGSTRMKAGLAQKMILQIISTATMTQLGHVYGNYMVGVRPTNEKLVARACGIISRIAAVPDDAARAALAEADHDVRRAIVMLTKGLSSKAAAQILKRHSGNLRKIL